MSKEITLTEVQEVLLAFIKEQRVFNKKVDNFIEEQRTFNEEQRTFNEEQKIFNQEIDKKADKVQYFLEEALATNTKMFFEEQIELKSYVKELEIEIEALKEDILDLNTRFNLLFKAS